MRFRQIHIFDRFSSERRRGRFPEDGAVGHGESPRLVELMGSGNLCDAYRCRVGAPQCRARHVQSSQQKVPGRTHAQEFGAANSQCSLWHVDRGAKRGHVQRWATMRGQRILKPNHDVGVMPPRFQIADDIVSSQAIDERVKQFLFERSRDFRIRD